MRGQAVGIRSYRFNLLSDHLNDQNEVRMYAQDTAMLTVTAAILKVMEAKKLDRATVARRIGKSKSFVSQVLSGSRNMTVRTLADLLWACDVELAGVSHRQIGEMVVPTEFMDEWLDGECQTTTISFDAVVVSNKREFQVLLGGRGIMEPQEATA